MALYPPWPVSDDTGSFWETFRKLDDSQETFDVVCALVARVASAAGDIPKLPDMDLRMLKSRRYHWDERIYRPLRLFFAFGVDDITAVLLAVDEENDLAYPRGSA